MDANRIIFRVREAFGSIQFPDHLGLHAAVAMDEWITDEERLREITREKDHHGEWWDVPLSHLLQCKMALDYLDDRGIEYYLPAYMVAIMAHPDSFDNSKKDSAWQILFSFVPDRTHVELEGYFESKMSRIVGRKKAVCRDFLEYVSGNDVYMPHARKLADAALQDDYWRVGG